MRVIRHLICLSIVLIFLPSAPAVPLLTTGDRLVFLGDDITEQSMYTLYVMDYFALRYPNATISFRNVGLRGEGAVGGFARLTRDVLTFNPTMVSILYGVNDGCYAPYSQTTFDTFMQGMTTLVRELKKAHVKVLLLTPSCVDPERDPKLAKDGWTYNQTLQRYSDGVKALAEAERLPFYDLHALMLDVQARAKVDNPHFTLFPDGVHPNAAGHAVIAYALLRALGCDTPASGLEIDATTGACVTDRCTVANVSRADSSLSFTRIDRALPTYFPTEVAEAARYFPLHEHLNSYPLKVTGLRAGPWKLTVEGIEVGTFTDDTLARGVSLGTFPGPWKTAGQNVQNEAAGQERLFFTRRWLETYAGIPYDAQRELQALLAKLDALIALQERSRQQEAAGHTWRWTLTLLP